MLSSVNSVGRREKITWLRTSTTAETLAHSKRLKNKGENSYCTIFFGIGFGSIFLIPISSKRKIKFYVYEPNSKMNHNITTFYSKQITKGKNLLWVN